MSLFSATLTWTEYADPLASIRAKLTAMMPVAQQILVEEAKVNCPVRSGRLRDSIQALEPVDDGSSIVGAVVATEDYAGFVELGTGIRGASSGGASPAVNYSPTWPGMEAQPFMRPALDSGRDPVMGVFS